MAFEEYPKVIYTGGVSVTVKDAIEEARWRASQVPAKAAPKAVEPATVVPPKPVEPAPVEHDDHKKPSHIGGKKK